MSQFLEDVGDRKAFVAWLGVLVAAALALGLAIPVAFASLIERAPSLSSFLSVEGNELGLNVIYVPAGMLAVTSFCLVLEAMLLGYELSTVKRIIANDTPSVRTDVFYLLFRVSGLLMVFSRRKSHSLSLPPERTADFGCLAVSDACGEAGDRPRYMDPSGYLFSNGS